MIAVFSKNFPEVGLGGNTFMIRHTETDKIPIIDSASG
jgi:hypothetical protein